MSSYQLQKLIVIIFVILPNYLVTGRKTFQNDTLYETEALEKAISQLDEKPDVLKGQDDVSELLKIILDAVNLPRSKHSRLPEDSGGTDKDLDALVLSQRPEKRKALSELLGMALNSESSESSAQEGEAKNGSLASLNEKELQFFSLPPEHNVNVQEFLDFLLNKDLSNSSTLSPSITQKEYSDASVSTEDMEKLISDSIDKQKIFNGIYKDIPNEETNKKTIDQLVSDLLNGGMRIHNFA